MTTRVQLGLYSITSILSGKYPTDWKIAKVVPLHKKGDRKFMKKYKPVALLSVPGMVLERVVSLQIKEYFENNKLLVSFQFGFRKNKSTISELLTMFDTLLALFQLRGAILAMDNQKHSHISTVL